MSNKTFINHFNSILTGLIFMFALIGFRLFPIFLYNDNHSNLMLEFTRLNIRQKLIFYINGIAAVLIVVIVLYIIYFIFDILFDILFRKYLKGKESKVKKNE